MFAGVTSYFDRAFYIIIIIVPYIVPLYVRLSKYVITIFTYISTKYIKVRNALFVGKSNIKTRFRTRFAMLNSWSWKGIMRINCQCSIKYILTVSKCTYNKANGSTALLFNYIDNMPYTIYMAYCRLGLLN